MNRFLKIVFLTALLELFSTLANAQRFSVGTNGIDWLTLGTINVEASIAVAQKVSIHIGGELNPWTFRTGSQEKQFQLRQYSFLGGVRWWPWHVYSGWWVGADVRYSLYNLGGVIKRDTEEGDAFGGGVYGGYSIMINSWLNLDLGVGAWGGWKKYTRYSCPVCGVITEQGQKGFIIPDARMAVQFVF